jgi:hypothetical protein
MQMQGKPGGLSEFGAAKKVHLSLAICKTFFLFQMFLLRFCREI